MGSSVEIFFLHDFSRKGAKAQRGGLVVVFRVQAGEIGFMVVMPYVSENELDSRKDAKTQRGDFWDFF